MPWAFIAILIVYGLCSIAFAFVEPPQPVRSLFRVPAVFIFLPDRLILPAGRLFLGVCSLATAGYVLTLFR